MAPRKAEGIPLATVARSVEAAVKIAAKRHDLAIDPATLVHRWEIFGRRLRGLVDMNVAYEAAADVTRGVNIPGLRLQPVATRIGREILIGFVERGRVPMVIPR